ncbi:MAG: hypothetical protein ACRD8W_18880, partial [Nitrososphaeraceae archaeon]
EWILKELLMQYRLIIHGDIDTFLKLRKRLARKIPKEYFKSKDQNKVVKIKVNGTNDNGLKDDDNSDDSGSPSIHIWTANGIWQ